MSCTEIEYVDEILRRGRRRNKISRIKMESKKHFIHGS
jgi:hypothetical protein